MRDAKVWNWVRICKPLKEPSYQFPAWRTGTTTLFDVPARQATLAGEIDSLESIDGLFKRLQIRALDGNTTSLRTYLHKCSGLPQVMDMRRIHLISTFLENRGGG